MLKYGKLPQNKRETVDRLHRRRFFSLRAFTYWLSFYLLFVFIEYQSLAFGRLSFGLILIWLNNSMLPRCHSLDERKKIVIEILRQFTQSFAFRTFHSKIIDT